MSDVLSTLLAGLAFLASPPSIGDAEKGPLAAGEVIVHPQTPADDNGFAVKAYALVDAPVAKVWPHLRDCGRYSEFMPRTKASAVREGTPDKGVCFIEIAMPFPFSNLWAENLSETGNVPGGGFERRWRLKQGTYAKNQGLWGVVPWEGGTKSLIYYALEAAPDTVIPDGILRKAQTGVLPDAFEAIRKRVLGP
jgi:hypothetical protein